MMTALRDPMRLLGRVRALHEAIRDEVIAACEAQSSDDLARVVGEEGGDTQFAIDRVSEAVLVTHCARLARDWPCLVIAEGLGDDGRAILPPGTALDRVEIVLLVDPIDGTRGLMYQKRPAWVLTGVAPFRGTVPTLADIELAVQTEIPLVKQHLSDTLWAVAGHGAQAERWDRLSHRRTAFSPQPSRATTIAQGYGGLARFFPGARSELAAIDDGVVERILGPAERGRAQTFEDQYISTGGQLCELATGRDRWIADLRPLLEPWLRACGRSVGICCHPYDLATELIAREAGVSVTDPQGKQLSAPFDVSTDVSWIGYANHAIRTQVEPALRLALAERGLLPGA